MASSSSADAASNAAASSSSSSETKKMITLKSSDGEVFEVEEKAVLQSETIKGMIEDDVTQDGIPLPNVTGKTMAKVMEYLNKHVEEGVTEEAAKDWDKEYVNVDLNTLFEIILAANYLNIKNLLDITCQAVADSIKDKQPDDIRRIFNIENDFTPDEEAQIRNENSWAFN